MPSVSSQVQSAVLVLSLVTQVGRVNGDAASSDAFWATPEKEILAEPINLFGARRRGASFSSFSFSSPRRRSISSSFSSPRRRAITSSWNSPRRRTLSTYSSPRRRTMGAGIGAAGAGVAAGGAAGYYGSQYHGGGGYNSHTVVTHQSAGDVMREKMIGAFIGLFLFIFGFPVLWFNEQRQAKMEELFGRAAKIARVNVDSDKVDPSYERNLVHMQGQTHSDDQLQDSILDATIKVMNCAHLRSQTEMFQWVESCTEKEEDDNFGGKTKVKTYSYAQEWKDSFVDSNSFNDQSYRNPPPQVSLGSRIQTANKVTFGAFTLPKGLVDGLCSYKNCTADAEPGSLRLMGSVLGTGTGEDVGDLRITFEKVPCGPATVLAVQSGDTFEPMPYTAEISGDGKVISASGLEEPLTNQKDNVGIDWNAESGESISCCAACSFVGKVVESSEHIFAISEAHQSPKDILQNSASTQKCLHFVLRIVGWLMICGGLSMMFEPFPTLFRFIPFLGIYVSYFIGWILFALTCLMGSSCTALTVGMAWMFARPAKAIPYLAAAAGCFACIYVLAKMVSS